MTTTDTNSTLTLAFGIAAGAFTVAFFVIPVQQIIRLCKTKNHTAVNELIFVILALNSTLWFSSFYRNSNFVAIFPHCVGLPLNLAFFSIFARYKYNFGTFAAIVAGSWGFTAGLLVFLIKVVPKGNIAADSAISMAGMVVNILSAFGPMQKIVSLFL